MCFWMLRKKSSPSKISTPSNVAESNQIPVRPAGIQAEPPPVSAFPSLVQSNQNRVGPADIYPNSLYTQGATNPNISQGNIQKTICNPNWSTKLIRPRTTYTNHLKFEQIREYGYEDTDPKDYEEDHFIPLELGGDPNDPTNLWPEPFDVSISDGGARFKDRVENYLHWQVCSGNLTLGEAQNRITEDWYRVYTISVHRSPQQ